MSPDYKLWEKKGKTVSCLLENSLSSSETTHGHPALFPFWFFWHSFSPRNPLLPSVPIIYLFSPFTEQNVIRDRTGIHKGVHLSFFGPSPLPASSTQIYISSTEHALLEYKEKAINYLITTVIRDREKSIKNDLIREDCGGGHGPQKRNQNIYEAHPRLSPYKLQLLWANCQYNEIPRSQGLGYNAIDNWFPFNTGSPLGHFTGLEVKWPCIYVNLLPTVLMIRFWCTHKCPCSLFM